MTQKDDLDEVTAVHMALAILKLLDGLTVGQARYVLEHAEAVLGMATRLDCASMPFKQAVATLFPTFTVAQLDLLIAARGAQLIQDVYRDNLLDCELTPEQQIAADVSAALDKHRSRNPGELAGGLTAALMNQVPPSVAIQALSDAIGK